MTMFVINHKYQKISETTFSLEAWVVIRTADRRSGGETMMFSNKIWAMNDFTS